MSRPTLRDILERQKQELLDLLSRRYIPRSTPFPRLDDRMTRVVLGPRRCGKSFFAAHLVAAAGTYGYANFDDESMVEEENYDILLAEVAAVYGSPRLLLLDEIQNLPRWELFVNRLQRQGFATVVTGSNAHLLGSELATHLTGRHLQIALFPFSFSEYRDAVSGGAPPTQARTQSLCRQFLVDGGYPEPIVTSVNRAEYIRTLFQATIYKDIVRRHRTAGGAVIIEDLARYLLSNTGSEYSYRTLAHVVGSKSDRTSKKYVGFLEEAFLFFSVPKFSYKFREQATANKKIYAIDNGMISVLGFGTGGGIGRLAENAVAIALKRREMQEGSRMHFWKNQSHEEVDFVVYKNRAVTQLIQVCWNMDSPKTRQREARSLIKAGHELRCKDLLIITDREEGVESMEWFGARAKIRLMPLWKWLLAQ